MYVSYSTFEGSTLLLYTTIVVTTVTNTTPTIFSFNKSLNEEAPFIKINFDLKMNNEIMCARAVLFENRCIYLIITQRIDSFDKFS